MHAGKIRGGSAMIAAGLFGLPGIGAASCASAFCTANTLRDVQGVNHEAGALRLDLHHEYINQDRLRAGTHNIPADQDTSDLTELKTVNRNWLATLDYAIDAQWGVTVVLPFVSRDHAHSQDPTRAATYERWKFSRLSDARVLGRYPFAGRTARGREHALLGDNVSLASSGACPVFDWPCPVFNPPIFNREESRS